MIKCYMFGLWDPKDYDYQKELNEVKELNPDYIFVNCLAEFEPKHIFKNLIAGITDWLVVNNKKMIILCSGPDGLEIAPNVILEKTCGLQNLLAYRCELSINESISGVEHGAYKWFTCYNNNPKYERALLVDQLAANHLLQHGIVTFHKPQSITSTPPEGFTWKYHDGSRLIDEPDYQLWYGEPGQQEKYGCIYYPNSYFKGFVDVTCESSYYPNLFFMSEKTAKAIAGLKPFIALSCADYHKYLVDEYGMVLYDELFDYSFDSKPNLHDRIQGIIDNLNNLVQRDPSDIRKLHEILLPKMLHNRQMILDYSENKEKVIPKSLKFLTETTEYELYGKIDSWDNLRFVMGKWMLK